MPSQYELDKALFRAVRYGDKQEVERLLAAGAKATATDRFGTTLLHTVDDPEIAKLLLAHGADVNAENPHTNYTPLHTVDNPEVARVLIENEATLSPEQADTSPLHITDNPEMIRLLVAHGVDVDIKWNMDESPLHHPQSIEKARTLIELGANVNAEASYRYTPLHTNNDNAEITQLLLENGANPNATEGYDGGYAPIHNTQNPEVARLLIQHGANVDLKTYQDAAPLHVIQSAEVARVLIEANADVNIRDKHGNTPLHNTTHRIEKDNVELTQTLINSGADVNALNDSNETPLMSYLQPCFVGENQLADIIVTLGTQDYSKLKAEHPEIYQKQQALLSAWVEEHPEHRATFEQAGVELDTTPHTTTTLGQAQQSTVTTTSTRNVGRE